MAALLICHYLADFCLTFPAMIRAKADGRSPWPIMLHAGIHAGLVGICLLVWGISWKLFMAHYLILTDMKKKPYWMLYGFDQLLHLLVIVMMWYCCVK